MQPDSGQVSFAEEKSKGYVSFIDEWIKEMNNVVEFLQQKKAVEDLQNKNDAQEVN